MLMVVIPGTAKMIMENIDILGFKSTDVKLLSICTRTLTTQAGLPPCRRHQVRNCVAFNMRRRLHERQSAKDPLAPSIDREGFLKYIDRVEEQYRAALKEDQQTR